MTNQVFRIPVSPAQRFVLFSITHEQAQQGQPGSGFQITSPEDSIKYRRFNDAFALKVISKVGKKHGSFRAAHLMDETPSMMEVTIENVEFMLSKVAVRPRNAAQDDVIGPLFDICDLVKTGKYQESDYAKDEDGNEVKPFDQLNDRKLWEPAQEPEKVPVNPA